MNINEEKQSMQEKASDKVQASTDNTFVAITFDLQAVLATPKAAEAQLYCRRKLAVYNLLY